MVSSVKNLWFRRHLLRVLVAANIKRQSKNTVLGYLWWLLNPLLFTAVYYLLVVIIFKRGGGNQPFVLFVMVGLLAWKAFSDSIGQAIIILPSQGGIIRAVSFPKAVLPMSLVLSNMVFFGFGLIVAVVISFLYGPKYGTWPNIYYILIPVVMALQILFTTGFALMMSAVGVLFKDTNNIMGHVLRMWYFLSPGFYSVDHMHGKLRYLLMANPFTELMTAYRDIIMYAKMPSAFDLGYALGIGTVTCFLGFWVFRKLEGKLVQHL